MNNALLDLVLDRLANKHHGIQLHTQAFLDENPEIKNTPGCWDALKFLHVESYILTEGGVRSEEQIKITPKGKLKIGNGGFSGEANYLQETLKVARAVETNSLNSPFLSSLLLLSFCLLTIIL